MTKRVSLRHLRCFLAVAETGSFTAASTRMFLTQSSLTAAIQQFEEAVGLKLFDRTTRRVVMTQEAVRFKEQAERILKNFDGAIGDLQAFAQSQKGHIRIAAAPSVISLFVVDAIDAFGKTYPDITFSLRDTGAEKVEQMVFDGEVDFALASKHQGYDDLSYTPLLEDQYGVIHRAGHELGRLRRPLRWSDLKERGYVGFSVDTGIGTFLRAHASALPVFDGHHDVVSSTTSLYPFLGVGNRYSVLPSLAAKAGESFGLEFRPLTQPVLSRQICLITRKLRSLSPTSRRLLDVLLETIEQQKLPRGVVLAKRAKMVDSRSA